MCIHLRKIKKIQEGNVVYTASNVCVLDIGWVKSVDPLVIFARANSYNNENEIVEYGCPEKCHWYNTGIKLSEKQWKKLSKDVSTEEICNLLKIKYYQRGR